MSWLFQAGAFFIITLKLSEHFFLRHSSLVMRHCETGISSTFVVRHLSLSHWVTRHSVCSSTGLTLHSLLVIRHYAPGPFIIISKKIPTTKGEDLI